MNRPPRVPPALGVLGLVFCLSLAGMVALGDLRVRFLPFLVLFSLAFVAWLLALRQIRRRPREPGSLAVVLLVAGLGRATLLLGQPSLSDDLWRYVLDGGLIVSGRNPYGLPPERVDGEILAPVARRVNHPSIPTIYPPVAELFFAATQLGGPSPWRLRAGLVLAEALLVAGLCRLLSGRGRDPALCVAWAWSPLAAVETALGGHVDAIGVATLVWGLALLDRRRPRLAALLFGLSAGIKYLAAAVAVALARWLRPPAMGLAAAVFAASWLPFAGAGSGAFDGLGRYARHWDFNAPLFHGLVGLLEAIDVAGRLKAALAWAQVAVGGGAWMTSLYGHVYPGEMARILLVLGFLLAVLVSATRLADPVEVAGAVVAAFLLLSPTLHPWYVLWAVPFLALVPSQAVAALSGLVTLSYAAAAREAAGLGWSLPGWVLALELLPVAGFLLLDLGRARQRFVRPGSLPPPRRTFGMPPSPFPTRSLWRRFREDTWPKLSQVGRDFWHSGARNYALGSLLLLALIVVALSVRRLQPVAGRLVGEDGAAVAGVAVEAQWYAAGAEAFVNTARPRSVDDGQPTDARQWEIPLARRTARSGADGQFALPGGFALAWPGRRGPFLRLSFRAIDPLSGEAYLVRRFRLADGREVAGAIDTMQMAGGGDPGRMLSPVTLARLGQTDELVARGQLVAAAARAAGVRLFEVAPDGRVRLAAHRFPEGSAEVRSVAFAGPRLLAFRSGGVDLLDPDAGLAPRSVAAAPWERLVGESPERWLFLSRRGSRDAVSMARPGEPPVSDEDLLLGDRPRGAGEPGPDELAVVGHRLFYLDLDGSVRVLDLDGSLRVPATLTDLGGPAVAWAALDGGERALVLSAAGATLYDLSVRGHADRLGQVSLPGRPVAALGLSVLSTGGVFWLQATANGLDIGRRLELVLDEVEAGSAYQRDGSLIIPRVRDVETTTESLGFGFDPVLGQSSEQKRRLRGRARLTGATLVDGASGEARELALPAPEVVAIRRDRSNRCLVGARTAAGQAVYARDDGSLLVAPW